MSFDTGMLWAFGAGSATAAPLYASVSPSPSFDDLLADCGTIYQFVRIEGIGEIIGDAAVQHKYCTTKPPASGNEYKPWLRGFPSQLSEEANFFGGRSFAGELSFEVLDGDASERYRLTQLLRDDAPYINRVSTTASATSLTITFVSNTNMVVGTLRWVQGEVVRLVSIVAGSTWNVLRAQLGTVARRLPAQAKVFGENFFTQNRRIRVGVGVFNTAGQWAEYEFANSWLLDSLSLQNGLITYSIKATSQEQFLDRRIAAAYDFRRQPPQIIMGVVQTSIYRDMESVRFARSLGPDMVGFSSVWGDNYRYILVQDEVIGGLVRDELSPGAYTTTSFGYNDSLRRGLAGTAVEEHTPQDPEMPFREVLVADADLRYGGQQVGSFRGQLRGSGVTTSRSTGTWTVFDHPMLITLCMLLSSAHPDDGLELTNHDGVQNFSGLPVGFGIGQPVSEVDVESFLGIVARRPFWRSANTVVGKNDNQTFTEWFREEFGWTGVTLAIIEGMWTAVLPTSPLEDQLTAAITPDDILTKAGSDGVRTPDVEAERTAEFLANRVVFTFKMATGQDGTISFNEDDFADTIGQSGYYAKQERQVSFNAPGVRVDSMHGETLAFKSRALALLMRTFRPVWRVSLRVPLRFESMLSPGQITAMTYSMLPRDGARSWNREAVFVARKTVMIQPGSVCVQFTVIAFAIPGRFGRISPSGVVTGITNEGDGTYTVTIAPNRYTDANAPAGFPRNDAELFQAGWALGLYTRDGVRVGSGTQSVVLPPGVSALRIDGNFAGSLATGMVLEFSSYDDVLMAAAQRALFVAIGGPSDIGTTGGLLWTYAEG